MSMIPTAKRIFSAHPKGAWVVLLLSLGLTFAAWQFSSSTLERRAADRAGFEAEDTAHAIERRIRAQQTALLGGAALFAASSEVTRPEFAAYVAHLSLSEHLPGLQGFGFARVLHPSQRKAYEARIRAQGFADFAIRPETNPFGLTSIEFLEPFDWRNRRAFGFDMFSEATRRAAMERARDSGEAAITGAVTLVQETEADVQRGFLMYVPVYDTSMNQTTVAERRRALIGFVYSPFRMADLMEGVLGRAATIKQLHIYDGNTVDPDALLYDSGSLDEARTDGGQRVQRTVAFGDRNWTLVLSDAAPGFASAEVSQPWMIAAAGLLIDALVFFVISAIGQQTQRAHRLAAAMTEDLKQQTHRERAVFDMMADGLVTTDADGLITAINPAAGRLLSTPQTLALGRRLDEFVSTDTDSRGEVALSRPNARDNASPVWLSVDRTISRHDGAPMTTWSLRDVTKARSVRTAQQEFIAVVSHELRTPLTSLSGALTLLRANSTALTGAKAASLMELAHRNADRLRALVDDVIDVEAFRSQRAKFTMQRGRFCDLVRKGVSDMETFAASAGVKLICTIHDEGEESLLDAHRMKQVLANLLSNAIKFTPSGGTVAVALTRKGNRLRLAVRDTGQGIAEENRRRIFEAFYQVDGSSTRIQQGTGLGLGIAQAIVNHHGGRLVVASRLDMGSCFTFTLPVLAAEESGEVRKAA